MSKIIKRINDARRKAEKPYAIEPSPSITAQYYRDLNRIVRRMAEGFDMLVWPVLEKHEKQYAQGKVYDDAFGVELSNAFADLNAQFDQIEEYGRKVANGRMYQASDHHKRAFVTSFKKTMSVDVTPLLSDNITVGGRRIDKHAYPSVREAINNNIDLIKTIPKQHFDKLKNAVYNGIASGDDAYSLRETILEINPQETRRAKLIARDQMQKLTSVLSGARQQDIGVKGYIWRTVGGESVNVRETHLKNRNKRFDWATPPPETGHPGEDVNCRCTAEPDLSNFLNPEATAQPPKRKKRKLKNVPTEPNAAPKKKRKLTSRQEMRKAEKEIADNKYETAIVYDGKGEVMRKKGGSHSVGFRRSELERMEGNTLTHNHPDSGGTFSFDDVDLFLKYDLKEVRAIDSRYEYSLKGKPKPGAFIPDKVKRIEKDAKRYAQDWLKLQMKKKNPSQKEAIKDATDLFLTDIHKEYVKLFKTYDMKYKRTKRK